MQTTRARQTGRDIQGSGWFGTLIMVGLISFGVVHVLIAVLALQIAFTGGGGEASQQGAFAQLAAHPFGVVLLVVIAAGLLALTVWQALEAALGHRASEGGQRVGRRLASAGRAIVYASLTFSALKTAFAGQQSGDAKTAGLTARLMSAPFGRVLVAVVGVAVLVVGGFLVYRGVTKKFTEDLRGRVADPVVRLGQAGYTAKGVAYGVVGVLFVVAAITYDPDKAGGLDAALRTLRGQPFGTVLLVVVALGIAAFGAYCFAWSRHAKH